MNLLVVDTQTWIITIVGWLIVFVALVVLIIIFSVIPKILNFKFKPRVKNNQEKAPTSKDNKYITGDETAAIAAAIYLFFDEQHDEESNVITIKRIERRYSPWSSKIYGLRNIPK